MEQTKYKCADCGYPAANETIFRELKSPYRESPDCPKCGSSKIVSDDTYCYRLGWKILKESGADQEIKKMDSVFLRLSRVGDQQPEGALRDEELPRDIREEFGRKSRQIEEIIQKSGVLKKMAELGVNINYNITVFRAR